MSGTVVSITARQGQTLNTNQQAPTILQIADLSTMTVQSQVSEADVTKLRGGMPVYFTTLGSQQRRWWGQLDKVEPTPTVTNNVVLYNALFEVPNNGTLMKQMTAQVFFVASSAKDTLWVPAGAVSSLRGERGGREPSRRQLRSDGMALGAAAPTPSASSASAVAGQSPKQALGLRRATVKVLDADGKLQERQVTLGVSNRVQVQILSGLSEGEQVVTGQRPAASSQQSQSRGGLQGPGMPGMGPPPGAGGGMGAGGGGRR